MDKREKQILSNSVLIFPFSKIIISKPFLKNAYPKGPKWEHQSGGIRMLSDSHFHNMFRNQYDFIPTTSL